MVLVFQSGQLIAEVKKNCCYVIYQQCELCGYSENEVCATGTDCEGIIVSTDAIFLCE